LVNQLRGVEPALSESEITRERLALEEAIRKVEAESARRSRAETPRPGAKPDDEQPTRATPQPARPDSPKDTKAGEPMPTATNSSDAARSEAPRKTGRGRWFGIPTPAEDELKEIGNIAVESATEAKAKANKPARPASTPGPQESPRDPTRMRDPFLDMRSARAYPPPEDEEEVVEERPPRSYAGLAKLAAGLVLVVALAGLLYWQWDNIAGLYQSIGSKTAEPVRETTPARPKISDRIGTEPQRQGTQPIAPVAQRVVLYEEDPADPQGKRFVGSAIWRTEMVSPGPGLAPELAVRADVEIPERRITMTWSIRRNTDQSLPASHTVEITFNLPADFPGGGIDKVPGILMKQAEQTRGVPLAGLAVKVTTGFFLIGLSAVEADVQRNVQLIKERAWFDVPIIYNNGRRAILAMEKGTPGERAFEEAMAAWSRATPTR
jgi:hypothetical protein